MGARRAWAVGDAVSTGSPLLDFCLASVDQFSAVNGKKLMEHAPQYAIFSPSYARCPRYPTRDSWSTFHPVLQHVKPVSHAPAPRATKSPSGETSGAAPAPPHGDANKAKAREHQRVFMGLRDGATAATPMSASWAASTSNTAHRDRAREPIVVPTSRFNPSREPVLRHACNWQISCSHRCHHISRAHIVDLLRSFSWRPTCIC